MVIPPAGTARRAVGSGSAGIGRDGGLDGLIELRDGVGDVPLPHLLDLVVGRVAAVRRLERVQLVLVILVGIRSVVPAVGLDGRTVGSGPGAQRRDPEAGGDAEDAPEGPILRPTDPY